MSEPERSTDQGPDARFPAHGRVRLRSEGQRMVFEAEGPFNGELAAQLFALVADEVRRLSATGPHDQITTFHRSALGSPEALAALGAALRQLVDGGWGPRRVAYVMGPDVEGASLMAPLYRRTFASAGLDLQCFDTQAAAWAWLDAPHDAPRTPDRGTGEGAGGG